MIGKPGRVKRRRGAAILTRRAGRAMQGETRDGGPQMKLSIPEMSCGHCRAVVEQAIAAAAPGATAEVDLAARTVTVTGAEAAEPILAALAAEGYPATLAG